MLRINNVNKYFNKGKRNEIRVINNTSLEFEKTGLVALLGPSGCGKTTLLNVIGGLDKVSKGEVFVNDQKITGRMSGTIDEIRNANIGYIFQNFNLVEDMTVYENVALVLRMLGVKDEKIIETRVNYVLEKVKMYRYRKRLVGMLSGGERQRVGIARAIVKDPEIILADEPTGNLDSKNTIQIMNIIKSISKTKLVILVTHEKKLADFYSDRIISLRDGKVISDEINEHDNNLDYVFENKIYLGDLDKSVFNTDGSQISYYSDKEKIDLDIAVRNGNIYIKSKNPLQRVEVIEDNEGIELVEGHYEEMTKEEAAQYHFEAYNLDGVNGKKYKSIMSLKNIFKSGFKKVSGYTRIKKLLLLGFALSAMFVVYSLSSFLGVLDLDESKFINENKNYIEVKSPEVTGNLYDKIKADENVAYILPGNSVVAFSFRCDKVLQTSIYTKRITGSLSDVSVITEDMIILGRMPENNRELIMDKQALINSIAADDFTSAGYGDYEDFLNGVATIPNMSDYTIVGIVDEGDPSIYTNVENMVNIMDAQGLMGDSYDDYSSGSSEQVLDYELLSGEYTLRSGSLPTEDYEVIVPYDYRYAMPLNDTIDSEINGKALTVVGYYETENSTQGTMYANNATVEKRLVDNADEFTIMPKDINMPITALEESNIKYVKTYEARKDDYQENLNEVTGTLVTLAAITLLISIVEIYLILRASFLSRIKEVGVYRAVGVKKLDIYKMFIGEIIAITIISSLPGVIAMSYIMNEIASISLLADLYMMNTAVFAISLLIILIANIFFGLLPVIHTLRKTPAQILSRTDIL